MKDELKKRVVSRQVAKQQNDIQIANNVSQDTVIAKQTSPAEDTRNPMVIKNTVSTTDEPFDLNLPVQSYNSIVFSHLMSSPSLHQDRRKSEASRASSRLKTDQTSHMALEFGQQVSFRPSGSTSTLLQRQNKDIIDYGVMQPTNLKQRMLGSNQAQVSSEFKSGREEALGRQEIREHQARAVAAHLGKSS